MLNPALCERETIPWISVKSGISQWLTTPYLMLPLLVMLALAPVFLWRGKRRRVGSSILSLPLIIYLLAMWPPAINLAEQGLTQWIPPDRGEPAEAIVLLGRGGRLGRIRVNEAITLWSNERAPLVFASGSGDAERMAKQLIQGGLPAEGVQSEGCSQTTEENAQFTAAILQPQGIERVILVTDPPHMLRSWLTFKSLGFEVVPYISSGLTREQGVRRSLSIVREYIGLASYGLLGRLTPRELPDDVLANRTRRSSTRSTLIQ